MTEQVVEETPRIFSRGERQTVNVLGILCEWKLKPEETGGIYGMIEILVPPGAGVPMHAHAAHEAFHVLEGQAEFERLGSNGSEWLQANPGDLFHIPGDTMHGFRNPGSSPARMLVLFGADLASFFEEAGVPVDLAAPPAGPPTTEQIACGVAIMRKHGMQFADPQ